MPGYEAFVDVLTTIFPAPQKNPLQTRAHATGRNCRRSPRPSDRGKRRWCGLYMHRYPMAYSICEDVQWGLLAKENVSTGGADELIFGVRVKRPFLVT